MKKLPIWMVIILKGYFLLKDKICIIIHLVNCNQIVNANCSNEKKILNGNNPEFCLQQIFRIIAI